MPRIRLHVEDGSHADLLPAGGLDEWLEAIRECRATWFRRRRFAEQEAQTSAPLT